MTEGLKKPELLAPAGDMERLKAAVKYKADAVYLGGSVFGMRTAPENFGEEQLKRACDYCHERGVRVYQTVNTLPRNSELSLLPSFLEKAQESGVDAFIVSDLGVMEYAKKYGAGLVIIYADNTFETFNVDSFELKDDSYSKR